MGETSRRDVRASIRRDVGMPVQSTPALVTPTSAVARVREVDLHWAELGSGPPLVLLHGLCDSHRTWFPVAPALARTRRVLMLDLAGHGESSRPDASYTLDWHANMVGALARGARPRRGRPRRPFVRRRRRAVDAPRASPAHPAARSRGVRRARSRGRASRCGGRRFRSSSSASASPSCRSARRARSTPPGAHSRKKRLRSSRGYNARPGTARAFSRSVRDVINGWGQHRHFLDRAHEAPSLPPIAIFWGDDDPLIPSRTGSRRRRS